MTLAEAIVQRSLSYIGVHEVGGDNRGPEVEHFLKSVHLPPGNPWCAAFAWTVVDEAARELGVTHRLPCTGSSLLMWDLAAPELKQSNPAPGDVYVLQHSEHTGHVGIVMDVINGWVVSEVSGNTFADRGGRAGNCVAEHRGTPEVTHGGTLRGFLRLG